MAGKRARGGFHGSATSSTTIQPFRFQNGQNPEGDNQPAGMHGQTAQAPFGAISSAAGVASISETARANMPNEAQIHTNRVRVSRGS